MHGLETRNLVVARLFAELLLESRCSRESPQCQSQKSTSAEDDTVCMNLYKRVGGSGRTHVVHMCFVHAVGKIKICIVI